MQAFRKKITIAAFGLSAIAFSAPLAAQNIVANGDFSAAPGSSGPIPGWVVAPHDEINIATGVAYTNCCGSSVVGAGLSGSTNQFAAFGGGNVANVSSLSQTLATTAGTSYILSYRVTALGEGTQSLLASLTNGGSPIASLVSVATAGQAFVTYTLGFTAASSATKLAFSITPAGSGSGDGIDAILDDVSVSAAPEPATWGMMILGFGIAGASLRTRRRAGALA